MRGDEEESKAQGSVFFPSSPDCSVRVVFFKHAAKTTVDARTDLNGSSPPCLLVDQNVRRHVVHYLLSRKITLEHTSNLGLERAPDEEIFEEARRRHWVILTHDRGFADPLRFDPLCSPGTIILPGFMEGRCAEANRKVLAAALDYIVDILPERVAFWEGRLVRFTPHGDVLHFVPNDRNDGVNAPYREEDGSRDRFIKACARYDTLPRFVM